MIRRTSNSKTELSSHHFKLSDKQAIDLWLIAVNDVKQETGLTEGPQLATLAAKRWLENAVPKN